MSQWFYKLQEKEHGPVSIEQIRELIDEGKLEKESLVRPEGSRRWKKMRQFQELERRVDEPPKEGLHHFVELPGENSGAADGEQLWVLLKRVKKTSQTSFSQSGPFSSKQIIQKLIHGRAEFSDYVWRQGFERWFRIGDLEEFDRREDKEKNEEKNREKSDGEVNEDTFAQTFPDLVAKTMSEGLSGATGRFLASVITKVGLDLKEADEKIDRPDDDVGPELTDTPVEEGLLLSLSQRRIADPREVQEPKNEEVGDVESTTEFHEEEGALEEARLHILPKMPSPSANPQEAQDDQEQDEDQEEVLERAKEETVSAQIEGDESIKAVAPLKRRQKLRAIRRTQSLVGVLMLVAIGLLGWTIFQYIALENKPLEAMISGSEGGDSEPAQRVDDVTKSQSLSNSQVVRKKAPKKTPSRKEKPVEIVKNPELELQFSNMDSSGATVVVRSSASPGQRIYLTLHGQTGNVLQELSFTKSTTLEKKKEDDNLLKFKDLGAPWGQYEVLVESGNSSVKRSAFLGVNNSIFHSKMSAHLKQISHRQQVEKRQLFYLAKAHILRLNRFLRRLRAERSLSRWRSFYRGWSSEFRSSTIPELKNYSHSRRNSYAFPDHWAELVSYRQDLLNMAKKFRKSNSRSQLSSAEAEISIISANLSEFKRKMGQLSLRKN